MSAGLGRDPRFPLDLARVLVFQYFSVFLLRIALFVLPALINIVFSLFRPVSSRELLLNRVNLIVSSILVSLGFGIVAGLG